MSYTRKVAICLEGWKKPIFARKFAENNFSFEEGSFPEIPGADEKAIARIVKEENLIALVVQCDTDRLAFLAGICHSAMAECAAMPPSRIDELKKMY